MFADKLYPSLHYMRPSIAFAILAILIAFTFSHCANIVAPTGGPRDTIPPKLVAAYPPDSSLNVRPQKIVLQFNEYIDLDRPNEKLIVSPAPNQSPLVTAKLRTVTVELKDSLQPNTTYAINLGNAILDLNEHNPFGDFQYVFSTGNYLDSLQIKGKISYAETGKADSNIAVLLYNKFEDSVVRKEKPLYYTRTDPQGRYAFKNLPPGTYKIFALKDGNNNLRYDQDSEPIAFLEDSIVLRHSIDSVDMLLFVEKPKMIRKDSSSLVASKGAKKIQYALTSLREGAQDLNQPLQLQFATPLRQLDSSKILLQEDSISRNLGFSSQLDDTHKKLTLSYSWKENTPYRLILEQGFAADTASLSTTKRDTLSFKTHKFIEYGSLTLHFNKLDSTQHYVVQLATPDNQIKYTAPLKSREWKLALLEPGEYEIRLLTDTNQNGVWDTGRYYGTKKQPERVITLQKITVRSNWDNVLDVKW